jgi:hypothetical protein
MTPTGWGSVGEYQDPELYADLWEERRALLEQEAQDEASD